MEIQGKIISILPLQQGISKSNGNEWQSQEYVIETQEQYPRKCCFKVFGKDKIEQFNIMTGEVLRISFDIDAHEYNGRWYNNFNARDVKRLGQVPVIPALDTNEFDDLPFGLPGDNQDPEPF